MRRYDEGLSTIHVRRQPSRSVRRRSQVRTTSVFGRHFDSPRKHRRSRPLTADRFHDDLSSFIDPKARRLKFLPQDHGPCRTWRQANLSGSVPLTCM